MRIAILLTCYNRIQTTLECLECLFKVMVPDDTSFDIYLVDDNSPDETGNIVKKQYPKINIIKGSGSLYWNGGMRLAWSVASKQYDYDFYIWLNDDTMLNQNAFNILIEEYNQTVKMNKLSIILAGSCCDYSFTNFTYGGKNIKGSPMIPNGCPQFCELINGNIVLIPKDIYHSIGNLSNTFSHSLGDFDYGLRAIKQGFKCVTTSQYIAICNRNGIPNWCNTEISFLKRLKSLYAINGLCLLEYTQFINRHFGILRAIVTFLFYNFLALFPPLKKK